MQLTNVFQCRGCIAASGSDSSITIRIKFSADYPMTVPSELKVRAETGFIMGNISYF